MSPGTSSLSAGGPARCGTPSGYVRHLQKGETPCPACRVAEARRKSEWRKANPVKDKKLRRRDNRRRRKTPDPKRVPSTSPPPPGMLASADVCQLAGITYRQLDYWVRTGRLVPSLPGDGSGSRRCWSLDDARKAIELGLTLDVARGLLRSVGFSTKSGAGCIFGEDK